MIYQPENNTTRPQTDWNIIIHQINEDRRRNERRLSIALEIAVLALGALAVWAVVVAVMEMTL